MSFLENENKSIAQYFEAIRFEPLYLSNGPNLNEDNYYESLQLLPNQFAYTINNALGTITNAKGFDSFLGYPNNYISLSFLLNLYHPDDTQQMHELVRRAYEFGMSRNPAIPFSVQFILSYRVRKADDSYVKILRQSTIFNVDENHKMVSTLSLCTDISCIDKSNEIRYQMLGENGHEFLILPEYEEKINLILTPREKEILIMISKGFASKEIAYNLKTSVSTIETHRKNILRKNEAKNMSQLIYAAKESGLI